MSQASQIKFYYKRENAWESIFQKIIQKPGINGFESIISEYSETISNEEIELLVVPLFELVNNSIIPTGLDIVRDLRLQDHSNFSTIFVVTSVHNIPDIFNPNKAIYYEAVSVIKNPDFNDIYKAILLAELVFKKNDSDKYEIKNILNINDDMFLDKFEYLIKNKSSHKITYREEYYRIFVNYYDSFRIKRSLEEITIKDFLDDIKIKYKETGEILDESRNRLNESSRLTHHLDFSNEIYSFLNEIKTKKKSHRVKYELFRAPVPFPLQELADAKKEIEKTLGWDDGKAGKKIKLLLVDNKTTKFKEEDKSTIHNVFEAFGISGIIDIEMIGAKKGDSDEFNADLEEINYKNFRDEKKLSKTETDYYKILLQGLRIKNNESVTYSEFIYHRIKYSHFILLDFFLDENDIYLAVDFIKDISEIKKKEGDYSTTWYFITSAVYDSVVKYSQSGLLAEYYESAVVNTGDDPTNKKRQIIFVYKLLTFIQSRLRSFKTFKDAIYNHMLNNEKEQGKEVCCVTSTNKNMKTAGCLENCKKDDCLEKMQTLIKRYLTEYDNIWSLFYDKKHKGDYEDIAVLLDDTIKKFLWLPEADWQMVQHQIDYINEKLKILGENRQFSCKYINGEIEKRSEIY